MKVPQPATPAMIDYMIARRLTDKYIAWGFFGMHLLGAAVALVLWLGDEPSAPSSAWVALAVFAVSCVPMAAAVGMGRYVWSTRALARERHAELVQAMSVDDDPKGAHRR